MKTAPRWTSSEDKILRSFGGCIAKAANLLPGRTYEAIRSRRQFLGVKSCKHWTRAEDNRLIKYQDEPLDKQEKRFKRRTREAIQCRRSNLGLTRVIGHPWFGPEVKRLVSLYPSAPRAELLAVIPRHSWMSIETKAHSIGVLREINRRRTPPRDTLREQIRKRAMEDGIALAKPGAQTNCGSYFFDAPKHENYNKIARAVEFFGGRLVIDWQDE